LTSQAACANPKTATSNPVSLTVRSITGPSVSISASSTALCSGQPVTFSATLTNGGSSPSYQWQVDGVDAGSTTPAFTSSQLANGDTISCIVTNEAGCAPATSNSIAMTIYPLPVIAPGQEFDVSGGQGVVLQPVVTGDINSYDWTPATGLSDTTIANPLANPPASTIYTLEATTAQGCTASGPITVKVFGQVSIPAAFSPNNDGHNDIFYVLEGPQGSVIESFAVFDRWGQCLFQVHDVLPGDATRGWNGNNRGQPASPGTYVYAINLRLAGGQTQVYRGTVILVR
jgi:gliding motility-associated-like protein